MKKRGILAFIIYLLGCVIAGLFLIMAYNIYVNMPEVDIENWDALGVVLALVSAAIIGIPSGSRVVLKFIQMVSGWKLFGYLCILIDVAVIIYCFDIQSIFTGGIDSWIQYLTSGSALIFVIPVIVTNVFALISNIISVKD